MLNPGIFFLLLDLPEGEKRNECKEHVVTTHEPPSTLTLAALEGPITGVLYTLMTHFCIPLEEMTWELSITFLNATLM